MHILIFGEQTKLLQHDYYAQKCSWAYILSSLIIFFSIQTQLFTPVSIGKIRLMLCMIGKGINENMNI